MSSNSFKSYIPNSQGPVQPRFLQRIIPPEQVTIDTSTAWQLREVDIEAS